MKFDDGRRSALPSVRRPNTTRSKAENIFSEDQTSSSVVAITSQEGVGVSNKSSWAVHKTIKTLRWSVAEQSRWVELEESQSSDSCQALA